jgi:hypothetical protein
LKLKKIQEYPVGSQDVISHMQERVNAGKSIEKIAHITMRLTVYLNQNRQINKRRKKRRKRNVIKKTIFSIIPVLS